jgi:hypothetical protein
MQGPANLIKGIGGAFKKLFGRKKKKKAHQCPPRPQCFKPPCMNPHQQMQGIQNQLGKITQQLSQLVEKFGQMTGQQGGAGQAQGGGMGVGDVVKALQDLLGKLTGAQGGAQGASSAASQGGFSAAEALGGQATGTGFSTGASSSGGASSVASEGGKIDGMMADAKKLMLSDKKEDQLKGQEMMQNAQNMFNMLSQLIKAQGDMAKAAIQNMR